MDFSVQQTIADISQAPGFDAKGESRTNRTCEADFESILGMLMASEHQVQSANQIRVEQVDSEPSQVCKDGSTIAFDLAKSQGVISDDQVVGVGSADSISGQDGSKSTAVTGGSSSVRTQLTSSGKTQVSEITLPVQGVAGSDESMDTAVCEDNTLTPGVTAQVAPKNDRVSFDVLRVSTGFVGNQKRPLPGYDFAILSDSSSVRALEDSIGLLKNAQNQAAFYGSDQGIKGFILTDDPCIQSEEVSNPVLVNSRSNPLLKRVAMLVDDQVSADWLVRVQKEPKVEPDFALGKPILEREVLSDLLPRDLEMRSMLDVKGKMASSADLILGGLPREQGTVEDAEASIDPVPAEIGTKTDSMESPTLTPDNLLWRSEKQVFLRQQVGLSAWTDKPAIVKAQALEGQTQSLPSQLIESITTRDHVRSAVHPSFSNRRQTDDPVAVLIDSLRGLLGGQDRVATLDGESQAAGVCRQIFDRIVDQISKSIGKAHQLTLRINTDEGERVQVDISLISNQVRARISVADVELRDLLASHGWLLVQRFEANGLVAQEIEFSLLSERDLSDNRRAKKWTDEQSSVDDLEEVLNDFEVLGVKSTGFDRFA